jgi:hypothetical protein
MTCWMMASSRGVCLPWHAGLHEVTLEIAWSAPGQFGAATVRGRRSRLMKDLRRIADLNAADLQYNALSHWP